MAKSKQNEAQEAPVSAEIKVLNERVKNLSCPLRWCAALVFLLTALPVPASSTTERSDMLGVAVMEKRECVPTLKINSLISEPEDVATVLYVRFQRRADLDLACKKEGKNTHQLVSEILSAWLDEHGYVEPVMPNLGDNVTYQWHSHTRDGIFVAYDEKNKRYYVKDANTGVVHKVNNRPKLVEENL